MAGRIHQLVRAPNVFQQEYLINNWTKFFIQKVWQRLLVKILDDVRFFFN